MTQELRRRAVRMVVVEPGGTVLAMHCDARPVAFEETELRSTLEVAGVDPEERQRRGETVYPSGPAQLVSPCAAPAPDRAP